MIIFVTTGEREGGRGGYGGDRFGDKKMGPGGDFNPEFQRVSVEVMGKRGLWNLILLCFSRKGR